MMPEFIVFVVIVALIYFIPRLKIGQRMLSEAIYQTQVAKAFEEEVNKKYPLQRIYPSDSLIVQAQKEAHNLKQEMLRKRCLKLLKDMTIEDLEQYIKDEVKKGNL